MGKKVHPEEGLPPSMTNYHSQLTSTEEIINSLYAQIEQLQRDFEEEREAKINLIDENQTLRMRLKEFGNEVG